MDGVVSNDVIKRRLPPWMLGVVPIDKGRVGDSKEDNGGRSREDEERVKKPGGRRPKAAQVKGDNFSDGVELEEEKGDVIKYGNRKRAKRKLNLDVEDVPERKEQKERAKRIIESSGDGTTGVCFENDEDEDLTVGDLMIFAKECLQEETVEPMKKDDEFGETVLSGNSIYDVQGNKNDHNKNMTDRQQISAPGVTTRNAHVTREGSDCKLRKSGDPTKDMLDLLLGPLLKKTEEKEKKKVESTDEAMDLNFEMNRHGKSAALGEEQATVTATKKKSSLRDTVAMLLD